MFNEWHQAPPLISSFSCLLEPEKSAEGSGSNCVLDFSYLPAAHAHQEADDIALLTLLQLFDVLEGTHLVGRGGCRC
jgi:hypothetical protein